jgi:hypothetical protein
MSTVPRLRSTFRIRDVIRVVRVPSAVEKDSPRDTRSIFKKVLGNTFVVRGFGPYGHLELDVSKIRRLDTIWIEPDCVQLFRRRSARRTSG